MNLLDYKKNIFSQNGEDGIIEKIFEILNIKNGICCEFGAWDGIHLSNCRNLILNGWKSIMIEADLNKYNELINTYSNNENVICLNNFIDYNINSNDNINNILKSNNIEKLNFLSIDIDSFDYEIFESLNIDCDVICIEINAGHNPYNCELIDKSISKNNIGQPYGAFIKIAENKGYKLICYSGNAFFIKNDYFHLFEINEDYISLYINFLKKLDINEKNWLKLVNKGTVTPYYNFNNELISLILK